MVLYWITVTEMEDVLRPVWPEQISLQVSTLLESRLNVSSCIMAIIPWYTISYYRFVSSTLKEYYEFVNEARPLPGFVFPQMLIFLRKCIFNHETKQSSKFQSDPRSNCFAVTIDVWTFLLLFLSHFTQVLECFDMWYFGSRFVTGAIFI